MNFSKITLFFALIAIYSCDFNSNSNSQNTSQKTSENENIEEMPCSRGPAEPIAKPGYFKSSSFVMDDDQISGLETIEQENGDRLIIKNWGCGYYCLTFRFETGRFAEDTTNLQFWFKKAVLLIGEINSGLEAPLNLEKGKDALINHIDLDLPNNYENLHLGEKIHYDGQDISSLISVDRIQKLSDKKYAVEITYLYGPL
ncbi:MAG: hypothetical protein MRY83_21290 [Flavobacteriales bacterium]|nr:hypothetical protein [Flavobacteriales bacterium]